MQASPKAVSAKFSFRTVFNKVDLPTPVFPKIIILHEDILIFILSSFKYVNLSSKNSITFFINFSFLTILKMKLSSISSKPIY